MLSILSLQSFCKDLINRYNLNLGGMTVLTELASGSYIYNPLIAAMAGAEKVYVHGKDSAYGKIKDVEAQFLKIASECGLSNIEIASDLSEKIIGEADIITNSGHLRPFDSKFITAMKTKAVLPLMWEPWEVREGEIDFKAAREKGILVLGTNEHQPPCDMRQYSFFTALNLMMNHGYCLIDSKILILGDQDTLALPIEDGFKKCGLQCERIGIPDLKKRGAKILIGASYLLVAQHNCAEYLIGDNALLHPDDLVRHRIGAVGVISGNVDAKSCRMRGISVFPEDIKPSAYMSYQPFSMGPHAVMDLFAAGLKVGAASAKARQTLEIQDAAKYTLENSPALDLLGDNAWIKE